MSNEFITIAIISFTSVLTTNAIDDWMEKGMIFRSYKYWLTVITLRKRILPFLYKPLGGCIVCMNIWVLIIMIILFIFVPYLWLLIIGASLSHWVLKVLNKKDLL